MDIRTHRIDSVCYTPETNISFKSTTCQENLIKKLQVKTMSFYLEKCIVQRIMHGMLKWGQLKNYKDSVSVNSGSSELRISLLELCLSQ